MRRKWLIMAVVSASFSLTPAVSWGQPRGPVGYNPARPTYSPYLNLLRGGSLVTNYYGLVRPQVDFSASLQQVENQVSNVQQQQLGAGGASTLPDTGHPVYFMNASRYFMTNRQGGGGGGGGGGAGVATFGSGVGGAGGAGRPGPATSAGPSGPSAGGSVGSVRR